MITAIGDNDLITAMGLAGVSKLIELNPGQNQEEEKKTIIRTIRETESKIIIIADRLARKYSKELNEFKGIIVELPEKKDFQKIKEENKKGKENNKDNKRKIMEEENKDKIKKIIRDTIGISIE